MKHLILIVLIFTVTDVYASIWGNVLETAVKAAGKESDNIARSVKKESDTTVKKPDADKEAEDEHNVQGEDAAGQDAKIKKQKDSEVTDEKNQIQKIATRIKIIGWSLISVLVFGIGFRFYRKGRKSEKKIKDREENIRDQEDKSVTDDLIEMSDVELHHFAIHIVRESLIKQGKKVIDVKRSLQAVPSIWFKDNDMTYWVLVRAVRYPAKKAEMPENIEQIKAELSQKGIGGYFASVSVVNSDDPFDPMAEKNGNFLPLYRGNKLMTMFDGIKAV